MSKTLCIAFTPEECRACAALASKIGLPFDLAGIGFAPPTDLGAETAIQVDFDTASPGDAISTAFKELASGYSHVATVSNMRSKDFMPALTALLDGVMVSDAIEVLSDRKFKRPIYAGSLIATVEVEGTPVMITFRPAGFTEVPSGTSQSRSVSVSGTSALTVTNRSQRSGARPDLAQAKVVVSGGRPLGDKDTFESVIGGFADALGGAAGATRAAVDSGIAANELQVGQTGKIVAPDLYIAAGVSGSTQHIAGIKDSKIIVAINKDPDAPIFEVADLGLVADLFVAIPEFRSLIGK
ncbi:MAG: electron transfer flavoprotein subunit alpha/FixB family protein [Fimbriimonadaceae bacterium]